MAQSWFYRHQDKTHGPLSPDEIKILAGKGILNAHDLLWPEGMAHSGLGTYLNFHSTGRCQASPRKGGGSGPRSGPDFRSSQGPRVAGPWHYESPSMGPDSTLSFSTESGREGGLASCFAVVDR
jgi:GYF domain 2